MPNTKKCLIPNNTLWVSYVYNGNVKYIITSKENNRDYYYLYELKDNKYSKIAKSKSPLELEKYIKEGD